MRSKGWWLHEKTTRPRSVTEGLFIGYIVESLEKLNPKGIQGKARFGRALCRKESLAQGSWEKLLKLPVSV